MLWGNRNTELERGRTFHVFIHDTHTDHNHVSFSALKKIKVREREQEEKEKENTMEGKKSPKNSQVQSFICLFKHKGPSGNSCPSQAGMEFTFSCSRIFLVSPPHPLWKATLLGRCPIMGSSRFCGRLCTAKVSVSVFIPCLLYRSPPFRGLTTAWEGA